MEPITTFIAIAGASLGSYILGRYGRGVEIDLAYRERSEMLLEARSARAEANRACREQGRLSRKIHKQRVELKKLYQQTPKPRRTREEWEAYRATKTQITPVLPH